MPTFFASSASELRARRAAPRHKGRQALRRLRRRLSDATAAP
jgi:hypothetical protein